MQLFWHWTTPDCSNNNNHRCIYYYLYNQTTFQRQAINCAVVITKYPASVLTATNYSTSAYANLATSNYVNFYQLIKQYSTCCFVKHISNPFVRFHFFDEVAANQNLELFTDHSFICLQHPKCEQTGTGLQVITGLNNRLNVLHQSC